MKYEKPLSAASFHKMAMDAAHDIAEEKEHTADLAWNYDAQMFAAQVRLFLCQKYSCSANSSEILINKYLKLEKAPCLSGRLPV